MFNPTVYSNSAYVYFAILFQPVCDLFRRLVLLKLFANILPSVTKGQKRDIAHRIAVYYGLSVKECSEVANESIEGCHQWQQWQ